MKRALLWIVALVAEVVRVIVYEFWSTAWTLRYGTVVPLQRGAKVTVVHTDYVWGGSGKVTAVVRARVTSRMAMSGEGRYTDSVWMRGSEKPFKSRLIVVPFAARGDAWCWGWDSEPARALRVAKALS